MCLVGQLHSNFWFQYGASAGAFSCARLDKKKIFLVTDKSLIKRDVPLTGPPQPGKRQEQKSSAALQWFPLSPTRWEHNAPPLPRGLPGWAQSSFQKRRLQNWLWPRQPSPSLPAPPDAGEDTPASSSSSSPACLFSYGVSRSTKHALDGGAKPGAATPQPGRPLGRVCSKLRRASPAAFPLQESQQERLQPSASEAKGKNL